MKNKMENRTQLDYCRQGYQDLINFQNVRIKALEKKVQTLEYLRDVAINDSITILKAQSDTLDWIEGKLLR